MALRRFTKARFMTDTSMTPETPNVAETAHFLRRFADMMQVGHNANFLHHAAVWLETLSARLVAAQDEEQIWRYKYETIAEHTDTLEAECEALRHDVDGHHNILASIMNERDALKAALQARETEVLELQGNLDRERDALATASQSQQQALADLRATFDRERETLTAAFDGERVGFAAVVERRGEELDQLRRQLAEQSKAHELELSQLRLGFAGERHDLAARLKVSSDELAALRVVSERERDALIAKVAGLEAKRAELRSAFDRIADLKNQGNEFQDGTGNSTPATPEPDGEAGARSNATPPGERNRAVGEADVVVPKATLRQARSQFEYLANEFTGSGDVASQVMCELGAFTMELALGSGRKADPLAVGDVALSILASPGSAAVSPRAEST